MSAISIQRNVPVRLIEIDFPAHSDRAFRALADETRRGTFTHTLVCGPKFSTPGMSRMLLLISEDRAAAFLDAISEA